MSNEPTPSSPAARTLLILAGIAFTGLWIAAHVGWGAMSLMGTVMANDSGHASSAQHESLITTMLLGQVVAGLAGIPGGLAIFWRSARKWLIIAFALLFVGGAVVQCQAFNSFSNAVPTKP
jgi:hypothetical protein